MFFELIPLFRSGIAVFLDRTCCAPAIDECPVGPDQVILEDRGVGLSAVEMPMPEDLRGDVQGSPSRMAVVVNTLRKSWGVR